MLSTDLSTVALISAVIVAGLSLTLAILCWVNARHARLYAANCGVWVEKVGKMRDPTAAVAELSAELTELRDSYSALLTSHKKLRSRIGMRENRAKGSNGVLSGDVPMTDSEKSAYKAALRNDLRARGLLR